LNRLFCGFIGIHPDVGPWCGNHASFHEFRIEAWASYKADEEMRPARTADRHKKIRDGITKCLGTSTPSWHSGRRENREEYRRTASRLPSQATLTKSLSVRGRREKFAVRKTARFRKLVPIRWDKHPGSQTGGAWSVSPPSKRSTCQGTGRVTASDPRNLATCCSTLPSKSDLLEVLDFEIVHERGTFLKGFGRSRFCSIRAASTCFIDKQPPRLAGRGSGIDGNSSLAQVTGAGAKRWQDEIKRRQTDPRSTNSAAKRKQRSGTERWHLERMKPPAVQLRQLFSFA